MAPKPVSEVLNAIAQKLLELLPVHLRPVYGSVVIRIVFQNGNVVKTEGSIETAQRK